MRKHILPIAVAALVCVLLAGVALAQPSGGSDPPTLYTVERGTASGGAYHLISLRWQVDGTVSGGEYVLLGPASPTLTGSGCCCTYMPCVLRNF